MAGGNEAKLKVTRDGGRSEPGQLGGGAVPGSASQSLYSQRPPEARGHRNNGEGFSAKRGPAQAVAGEFSVLGTTSSSNAAAADHSPPTQ
jgi:hypothetical protein